MSEKGRWLFQSCKHTSSYLWGVQARFAPDPAAAYVALPYGLHSDPHVDTPVLLRLFSTWSVPEEWSQETESAERKRHECNMITFWKSFRSQRGHEQSCLPFTAVPGLRSNSSQFAALQGFNFLRHLTYDVATVQAPCESLGFHESFHHVIAHICCSSMFTNNSLFLPFTAFCWPQHFSELQYPWFHQVMGLLLRACTISQAASHKETKTFLPTAYRQLQQALGGNRTHVWRAPLSVAVLYFILEITFTLEEWLPPCTECTGIGAGKARIFAFISHWDIKDTFRWGKSWQIARSLNLKHPKWFMHCSHHKENKSKVNHHYHK